MSSTSKTCFVGIAISEYCSHYYYAVFHHYALSLSVPEPDVFNEPQFLSPLQMVWKGHIRPFLLAGGRYKLETLGPKLKP